MTIEACPEGKPIYNLKAGSEEEAVANAQIDFGAPESAVCAIGDKYYLLNATSYSRKTGKEPVTEKERLIDKIEKGRMDLAFGLGKMAETKGLLDRAKMILAKGDGPPAWLKFATGVAASSLNFGVVVPAFEDAAAGLQIFLNKRWGLGNSIETAEALNRILRAKGCSPVGMPFSSTAKKSIGPILGLATGGALLYALNAQSDEAGGKAMSPLPGVSMKDLEKTLSTTKADEKSPIPDRADLEKMSLDEIKKIDTKVKDLTEKMTKWQEKYAGELKEANEKMAAKGLKEGSDWEKSLLTSAELGLGFGIGSRYGARWWNASKPYGNWLARNLEALEGSAQNKAWSQFEELAAKGMLQCTGQPETQVEPSTSTELHFSTSDPGFQAVEMLTAGAVVANVAETTGIGAKIWSGLGTAARIGGTFALDVTETAAGLALWFCNTDWFKGSSLYGSAPGA